MHPLPKIDGCKCTRCTRTAAAPDKEVPCLGFHLCRHFFLIAYLKETSKVRRAAAEKEEKAKSAEMTTTRSQFVQPQIVVETLAA